MVDLVGKRNKMRSWAKVAVDIWCQVAKMTEIPVFRSIRRDGHVQPGATTAQAIFNVVTVYSARVGVNVVPHDLHYTFAELAHKGSSPVDRFN